jgi:hypothetical protein
LRLIILRPPRRLPCLAVRARMSALSEKVKDD